MFIKRTFELFTFFCFTRSVFAQTSTTMSNFNKIFSVVYVTFPANQTGQTAKDLAHGLVKAKLAACVNIIPKITSVYEWENEINEDSEELLMIKTRTDKVDELTNYVMKNHPYKVCEVISVPIQNGSEKYLQWIGDVVPAKNKPSEK